MNPVELCWNITSYVSIIVQLIVAGICLGIFVSPYMPGGSKAVKAGAVYGVVMTVLYIMPPRIDNILAYLNRNFLNLGIIESRNYIRISYGSFLYAGTNGISPFS